MKMLRTKADYQTDDLSLKVIEVPVPEWGDDVGVYVRMLVAGERDDLEAKLAELRAKGSNEHQRDFRARACVAFCSDEKRQPIFDEDDIPWLSSTKSGASIDRIYDAGRLLNRMFLSDAESAEKNSATGRGSDSSSGSPATLENPSPGSNAA